MAASMSTAGPSTRVKPPAENWDEDFEFVPPKRAARPATGTPSRPVELASEADKSTSTARLRPRRASSPVEDWDAVLPESEPSHAAAGGSAPLSSGVSNENEPSQQTTTIAGPLSGLRLSSPSFSQPILANGRSTEGWSRRAIADDPWLEDAGTTPNNVYHPSGAVGPDISAPAPNRIHTPSALFASPARTLHYSKSTEQMPPPPAPISASPSQRMSSRSSSRATLNEEVTAAGDGVLDANKKPGFWKRLSGNPGGPSRPSGVRASSHHRRRSSAFLPSRSPAPDLPPIPPVPSSMRFTSGTSAVSAGSALSQGSSTASAATGSDQTRSGLASLSGMLRRSSSRLSRAPRGSPVPPIPPSSSVAGPFHGGPSAWSRSSSASSRGPTPAVPSLSGAISASEASPRLASSASFSRGFHLPSPSPQSPYNHSETGIAAQPRLRSLPRSPSFPTKPTKMGMDGLGILPLNEETSYGRKARPVSAVLSPYSPSQQESATFGQSDRPSSAHAQPPAAYAPSSLPPTPEKGATASANGLPRSPSMAKSSTFRRLASASRKHGRRISGGWRFGSAPSSPAAESKRAEIASAIRASQSDTGQSSVAAERALPDSKVPASRRTHAESAADRKGLGDVHLDAASADPSHRHSSAQSDPPTAALAGGGPSSQSSAPILEHDPVDQRKSTARRKRRSSWGDFVIPREVLDKQKGVKRGIGAVKQFAAGVESLKALERLHASTQRRLSTQKGNPHTDLALLERDYAQYWEMASVLIELASTGQDDPDEHAEIGVVDTTADLPSASGQSPKPVTASSEPNVAVTGVSASKTSRVLSSSSADWDADFDFSANAAPKATGLRTSSLPEPDRSAAAVQDSSQGPPRADLELWHASTGRHDLSKRQLEVLRTMLTSPIGRDELPQADLVRPSEPTRRETAPEMSKTFAQSAPNTPNPGVEQYAPVHPARDPRSLPSVAFSDARITAAESPNQTSRTSATAVKRRASRSGLGGFKDFIRKLGKDRGHDASMPSRSQSMAHLAIETDAATGLTRSKSEAVIADAVPRTATDPPQEEQGTARVSAGLPRSRSRRTGLGLGWPEEPPSTLDAQRPRPQGIDAKEVVLALTPENLPVLLQYLRQCENKLREWETKADLILRKDTA